jgi:hypothetical protein
MDFPLITDFKRFDLSELEDATHNFLEDNKIGRGTFATVYKVLQMCSLLIFVWIVTFPIRQFYFEMIAFLSVTFEMVCPSLATLSKKRCKFLSY